MYFNLKILFGEEFSIYNYKKLNNICKNSINISIIITCIGLFTMYFHGTLSFSEQILDEYSIYLIIMLLDFENKFNFFIRLIAGFLIINIISEYNRIFLFSYGFYRSLSLYKKYFNEKNYKMKILFTYGNLLFFFSVYCWMIDEFWCNNINISIHLIWHILSSFSFYS